MRTGALSDEAIKEACSEFFPVPMSAYNLLMVNHSNQSIHQFRKSKYTQTPSVPRNYFAMSNSMARNLDPTNDGALVSRLNQQFRNEMRLPPANPPQQPPPQPPGTGGGGGGGNDDDDDDDDDDMQGGGNDGNVTEEEEFQDAVEAPDSAAPNISTPVRPQAGQAGSSTDPLPESNQVENVEVDSTPASQQQIIEPQNELARATNNFAENYHSGVEGGSMPDAGSNPPVYMDNNAAQEEQNPPSNVDANYTPTFTRYEPTITSGELSARPPRISDTQRQLTHTLGREGHRMSSLPPTPASAERTNVVVDGEIYSANAQGVREDLVNAIYRNQIQDLSLRRNKTPRPESEAQAQAQSIAYNQAQAAQQEDQSMDVDEPELQGTRQSERLKGKPRKRYGK